MLPRLECHLDEARFPESEAKPLQFRECLVEPLHARLRRPIDQARRRDRSPRRFASGRRLLRVFLRVLPVLRL